MSAPDVSDELRLAGLRVTAPRQSVLRWLMDHPHATAEQIRAGVAEHLGSVSTQTVYDVLAACTRVGLVRRIEPAGHPARFERRAGDNHHHLVCRACGRTEDVDCAVGARPCLAPGDDHGYVLDEAEVVFWGLCPTCHAVAASGHETGADGNNAPSITRRHGSDQRSTQADDDGRRDPGRE